MVEPARGAECGADKTSRSRATCRFALRRAAALAVAAFAAVIVTIGTECRSADSPRIPVVSIDRSLQQPLATAHGLIARGQAVEAIRPLQPLLSDRENALVEIDGAISMRKSPPTS